jgi:ABC-type antimicrobial peptide transport system permease subunit
LRHWAASRCCSRRSASTDRAALVNSRLREIAIRLALGASPRQTLWRTLTVGLWPVLLGAAAGVALTAAAMTSLRSLLFGIERLDSWSLGLATAIVVPVAAFAALGPALRAARVDPIATLRAE